MYHCVGHLVTTKFCFRQALNALIKVTRLSDGQGFLHQLASHGCRRELDQFLRNVRAEQQKNHQPSLQDDIVRAVNHQDNFGRTALHYAAACTERSDNNSVLCASTLIEAGASSSTLDLLGQLPMHRACDTSHQAFVKFLIESSILKNDLRVADVEGYTGLLLAARAGSIDICRLILDHADDAILQHTLMHQSALHFAVLHAPQITGLLVELLIERGADVSKKQFDGLTAGELAARQVEQGHVLWPETVAWLLTGQRGRPATPPQQAMLHLSAAVKAGDLGYVTKVLQGLKEMRKKVLNTSKDNQGFMLLHLAACFGHLQLCRSLITMGSKVDLMNDDKSTPLHLALASNQTAIAELLLQSKADPLLTDSLGFNSLHIAAATKGVKSIISSIFKSAGLQMKTRLSSARDIHGLTPVHVACLAGNLEVLTLICVEDSSAVHFRTHPPKNSSLSSKPKNEKASDSLEFSSETSIMLCLDFEDELLALKMIRVLVGAGCNPFTPRDPDNKTPAIVALERNLTHIVDYWLDEVGPLDTQEWTSIQTDRLFVSAGENRLDELRTAFEPPPIGRRLNCDMKNEKGETVLLAAAARSASSSIAYLLTRGCNVNLQNADGNTSMHLACLNVDVEEAKLLFEKSTSLVHSLEIRKHATAAAAKEDAASKGLSGRSVERYVLNAVDAVVRSENKKWTKDYLLPGSPYEMLNLDIGNCEGDTPLHIAALLGNLSLVEFLISVGADASEKNKQHLTALEVARLAKCTKVLERLKEAEYKRRAVKMQEEREDRVAVAKKEVMRCTRLRQENAGGDADVRAKIGKEVDRARIEFRNASEAATLESCMEVQRMKYKQDTEFVKTAVFAHRMLEAIASDNIDELIKLIVLIDDVTQLASTIIPDLSPRDMTAEASKIFFLSWKREKAPSKEEHDSEQHSPARKKQREAAEAAGVPRRAAPMLHVTVALGKAKCLELLLRLGVPANWCIEGYITPLHIACQLQQIDACKILISHGASVEARNEQGRAVIYIYAMSIYLKGYICEQLICFKYINI